jgi:hypothetical protein
VTNPPEGEALAALAIQVAALRGNLALTRRELEDRLDKISEALSDAIAASPKGPPATWWPGLSEAEREAARAQLAEWLASFLREWYPGYCAEIPGCIPDHPEGLVELSNLLGEFRRIYTAKHPPLADALTLHDRYFPGVLRRLATITRGCGPGMCSVKNRHPGGNSFP